MSICGYINGLLGGWNLPATTDRSMDMAKKRKTRKRIPKDERERYARYLCSRRWAVKRTAVITRSGGTCEKCRLRPVSHVHHLTYIRKYKEKLTDLIGLCVRCHEHVHDIHDKKPKQS